MTHEQFQEQVKSIPNDELIKKAELIVSNLCKTGAKSFTMSVPPRVGDSDIILSELIQRFKVKAND